MKLFDQFRRAFVTSQRLEYVWTSNSHTSEEERQAAEDVDDVTEDVGEQGGTCSDAVGGRRRIAACGRREKRVKRGRIMWYVVRVRDEYLVSFRLQTLEV